jgi:hypothetical protein
VKPIQGSAVDEQRKGARPEYVLQAAEDSLGQDLPVLGGERTSTL